jgi:hypothetical protein
MQWNLEGKRINGMYLGLWPYTGTVESSRVKLGGSVQHTVVVDEPFKVYGEMRERILVEDFNRILDQRDAEFEGGFVDVSGMSEREVRNLCRGE